MVAAQVFDVSVRFGSTSVFVSAIHGVVEVRELRDGRPGPLLHRYPITEAAEVRLFVGAVRPRTVLQLARDAVDLGHAPTVSTALRDALEVAKLVNRPLAIREEDYLDLYFVDHAPILHAYGEPTPKVENPTDRHQHAAYRDLAEVAPEDRTLEDELIADLSIR